MCFHVAKLQKTFLAAIEMADEWLPGLMNLLMSPKNAYCRIVGCPESPTIKVCGKPQTINVGLCLCYGYIRPRSPL